MSTEQAIKFSDYRIRLEDAQVARIKLEDAQTAGTVNDHFGSTVNDH